MIAWTCNDLGPGLVVGLGLVVELILVVELVLIGSTAASRQ